MKKVFFALMCVATLVMVGCKNSDPNKSGTNVKDVDINKVDNKTEKCWAIGATGSVDGIEEATINYAWGTEKDIVQEAQDMLAEYDEMASTLGLTLELTVKYQEAEPNTMEDCAKQDEAAQKEYTESGNCWKVSVKSPMYSEDQYIWGHEATVKIAIAEIQAMLKNYGITTGVEINYDKTDAADPDSCEKNNKN